MGLSPWNTFPDGAGSESESSGKGSTIQSFNGIKAILEHLDHIARLKDYQCARTKEIPDLPLTCYVECHVAQWLHSENVKECANRKLLDSVCKRCEEFHERAAQSILRTKMDMTEPVSEVVQSTLDFESASSNFQTALAALHVECGYNQ
ncbi:MAG: hypothetical protein HZB47_09170 [Nitrosomonadales bacterium]|nr:hypothetical protein [Nitrosomonadales bacterium]